MYEKINKTNIRKVLLLHPQVAINCIELPFIYNIWTWEKPHPKTPSKERGLKKKVFPSG